MAKILFVHGMRMQSKTKSALREAWHGALARLLERTDFGKTDPSRIPSLDDVELAYWADFFAWPDLNAEIEKLRRQKGVDFDALVEGWYSIVRGLVSVADWATWFSDDGRPRGPMALPLDRILAQTATYMSNGPVYHPNPAVQDGAFFQVQARFAEQLLDDTEVVIAHSIGTVIAYEGLCAGSRNVHTLITIGSPLATPHLVVEPLKRRLLQLKKHPVDSPLPWPGRVRQWLNFYAKADVWCTPCPTLGPLFGGAVKDVTVEHGTWNPYKAQETHDLVAYLDHLEIGEAIAEALQRAGGRGPA